MYPLREQGTGRHNSHGVGNVSTMWGTKDQSGKNPRDTLRGDTTMMPKQERQDQLLDVCSQCLTSCQWLDRRFVHAENCFVYVCGNPEEECHKTGEEGVANMTCLMDPNMELSGGYLQGERNGDATHPIR